jgi:hypothetical protein
MGDIRIRLRPFSLRSWESPAPFCDNVIFIINENYYEKSYKINGIGFG